jgi:hypothetical protein
MKKTQNLKNNNLIMKSQKPPLKIKNQPNKKPKPIIKRINSSLESSLSIPKNISEVALGT